MTLHTVRFRHWLVEVDSDATRRAYEEIGPGFADACACPLCCNFIVARQHLYPAEVLALFDQLGINLHCEIELYHVARLNSGLHDYGGWFHGVGRIIVGADAQQRTGSTSFRMNLARITESLLLGVSASADLVQSAFGTQPVFQVEFAAEIPWLIDAPEPD